MISSADLLFIALLAGHDVQRGKPVRKLAALTPTFLPTFAIRLKSRLWCPHLFFKEAVCSRISTYFVSTFFVIPGICQVY